MKLDALDDRIYVKAVAYAKAQALRRAGKSPWIYVVDLRDVYDLHRSNRLSFEEFRDQVVARLRASKWIKECGSDGGPLDRYVDDLAEVDPEEYNDLWEEILRYADVDRALIKTK